MSTKTLEKLLEAMRKAGMRQGELERVAGLASNRIAKWKNGQGKLDAQEALRLAKALGVDVRWLIDDELTSPPDSGLTEAEQAVLGAWHGSGLSVEQTSVALVRMARELGSKPAPSTNDKRRKG